MLRRLGYSSTGSTGTLKIVSQLGESECGFTTVVESLPDYDTASRYIHLIREIPSQKHVEILVRSFFANVGWQFDVIDEETFRDQLFDWGRVSYSALKQGPDSLPISTRYFPALLLQVLAIALLSQPTQYDNALDDLKYAPGIDFPDLAADYSNAGHRLMSLLGTRNTPLCKVQAGLMKACFEKTIGSVIESWHTLGSTIRDAQELGLHLLNRPGGPPQNGIPPRELESRRRLWLILHLWDAHMAVVLGRPLATTLDPSDVGSPSSTSSSTGSTPRSQHDEIVSLFDMALCGYHAAFRYLPEIYALEATSPNAQETVKTIHDAIIGNISRLPAWATAPSPILDVKYPWLSVARESLLPEMYFVLLALHRPFMSVSSNRKEALKAALQMLESYNRLFSLAKPNVYTSFAIVFGTFDAMVLVAATYLDYPDDNPDLLPASMNCMEWGLARLDAMRSRNTMAGLAYTVVQGLYQKLIMRKPVPNLDGQRNLSDAPQAPSGEEHELGAFPFTSASAITQQDLDNSLWPQPMFDFASEDAIGDIWQIMDDLT
ncbi:fungal-specific transcription factor domain-containing protein [Plectosphaerella plurivora]|uniref:Fungal-specific transcription factor domain-containing protein n=1 Tax=Plectosphaerella plurivora TaxID=936078 RepID=A0A9P9AED8_9PEZI|nr:fungal-specific transcription factor domain-containing protein [Plectosphaerella plurivora]